MQPPLLRLKKNEDRRLRAGHVWVYSNEIDTAATPLKSFQPGEEVIVTAHDKSVLGVAYINPNSLISARVFSRNSRDRLDTDFLIRQLQIALALRSRLYSKPFYRLVFGESDNLPGLVVDRFHHDLVVQINTAGMERCKDFIVSALLQVLPETQSILFRNDSSTRRQEGLPEEVYAGFGTPPQTVTLEENNTLFNAPLWQGQKTGWFYDHRLNRSRLTAYAANQRTLDVFSYLGGWGIQAAKAGAKSVVCVDVSATATQFIETNAKLNQVDSIVQTICDDAFEALKKLSQAKEQFDLIILDPPAFAKKQKDKKEGFLAYQRINELALRLLAPNGILISCSCSMHIDFHDFTQAIRKAAVRTQTNLQILERGHQAPDHPVHIAIPETDYLKMVVAKALTYTTVTP